MTPLPCARDPRCQGIEVGEFYFGHLNGTTLHAVGSCRDRDGKLLPVFPWDEQKSDHLGSG
jgi:hypothetical protein